MDRTRLFRLTLGALPLLTFLTWWVALYLRDLPGNQRRASVRNTVLKTAALMGLWIVLVTEGLSAIHQLRFVPILILWIVAAVGGIFAARHYYDPATRPGIVFPRPRVLTIVAAVPLLIILALAFASAACNPPNNYDSYTYHLPRQVMWLQHANVRHYPANNLRQLEMSPFAEFVGVQLMALSDSDRWNNLVQFAALLITFCGISLLTERLGGDRPVQFLACTILLTSPVAFMEASNTKNDIVLAMWIVICTCWLLQTLDGAGWDWLDVVLFGSAIGCAADTKGTGPLFLIPIVLTLCFAVVRQFTARRFKMLCAMGLLALAINLPHFGRNYLAFGHIDGPPMAKGNYPLLNDMHGPRVLLSNLIRLFASHSTLRYQSFNDAMYRDVVWIHDHVLHIGVNDPRTTTPFSAFKLNFYGNDEDRAGAPELMLLLLLLPPALVLARRRIEMRYALLICGIALLGIFVFCWVGKWQEWHTRYFIPQTALFAPVLAVALGAGWRYLAVPILALFLAWSLLPTIWANPRHLFGPGNLFDGTDLTRRFTYFGHDDDLTELARLVRKQKVRWLGFSTDDDFPEYAVMYILKARNHRLPKFEYVNPYVKITGYAPQRADLIVVEPRTKSLIDRATGIRYVLYQGNTMYNILLPQGVGAR